MMKRTGYLVIAGMLTLLCLAGCSSLKKNTEDGKSTMQADTGSESEETAAMGETIYEQSEFKTPTEETADVSELFTADSPDITARSIALTGPVCTKLVIKNSNKIYSDTTGTDQLSVKFEPEDELSAVGWWVEEGNICIQFWNINNKTDLRFSIDGIECRLSLPEAVYETVELHTSIDDTDINYIPESIDLYQDAAVLSLQMQPGVKSIKTIKLKTAAAEYFPSNVDIDDATGKIKILYQYNKTDISDMISAIQGIICEDQFVKFD